MDNQLSPPLKPKARYGRRQVDNGWKAFIRDYGILGLIVASLFYAGIMYNKVEGAEKGNEVAAVGIALNVQDIKAIKDAQEVRAKEFGQVLEGLRLVQEQNRTILQTILNPARPRNP